MNLYTNSKKGSKMDIYHYNKDGVYIKSGVARSDPLEKGKFLIPANATTEEPPVCSKSEEVYFTNKWNTRIKKTEQPTKYHTWDDKTGWNISKANQTKLDSDIVVAGEEKEKANLLSENEAEIQAEIRLIAIESIKVKKEAIAERV